ncbi:MAG TPA: pyridoxal phosphate-dependent aminotransferase [Nitrospiria bacterium]|jgi:aspartate aminotransferase|nr:pyridoxal phosphate-dependent aminotransferase [Nitrospiria bacterium]
MKLAQRVSTVQPSATLALSAKAKALKARGIEVIDFGLGEPDFDTPEAVKNAAIEALRAGFTKYTAPGGIDELKAAIAEKFQRDNNLRYEKNQIVVSCGAKHSLYNLAQVLFERGDEVLIPAPYWVSYPDQVRLNDATPVFIETREENRFLLTRQLLSSRITSRTKALILNTPSNPTGSAYTQKQLEELAEVILEKRLIVISDEIYEPFVYDQFKHVSIAALRPELKERTIVVNGVSKSYAMTGWRIGYAAGPKEVISAIETVQSQSTSNPTSIAQKAAVAALGGGSEFTRTMVAEFDRRRRYIVDRLNRMPGVTCLLPTGAFYAFPNITGLLQSRWKDRVLKTANDLAEYFLEEARVALVAGDAFGAPGHLRISYATALPLIEKGMDRMAEAISKLKVTD